MTADLKALKKRTYEIVEGAAPGDRTARFFGLFIVSLIGANIVALALDSMHDIHEQASGFFECFEIVSVVIFSAEYLLRLWSCTESERYAEPLAGRLRFALTPMALVDLVSVVPFYLPFLGIDLRFMRAPRLLRVFRLLRLFKLGRYSRALKTLGRVFRARKEELLVTLTMLSIILVMASSLIYYAENETQPDAFSSIPESMWWAVVTLTSVGYGDVYPKTAWGKVLAGIIAVCGIGMFALPAGILGSAFVEEIQNREKEREVCPHCGKELES